MLHMVNHLSIEQRQSLNQPVKNKQKAYKKIVEMSRSYNYTTGNFLYYLYHQKYYNFIGIYLLR